MGRTTLEACEQVVVKLFGHCGFTYDPGGPLGSNEFYAVEVVEIPYREFQQYILPGYWVRSAALHLHDIKIACQETSDYLRLIPKYLRNGADAMRADWLEQHLPVVVSDELRMHVFCFLTFSETIRDIIRTKLDGESCSLVPAASTLQRRFRIPVAALSEYLAGGRWSFPGIDPAGLARQLSDLDVQCRRTRDAIDELVASANEPVNSLVQAFGNSQAAILDLARTLLYADYAVDVWAGCML